MKSHIAVWVAIWLALSGFAEPALGQNSLQAELCTLAASVAGVESLFAYPGQSLTTCEKLTMLPLELRRGSLVVFRVFPRRGSDGVPLLIARCDDEVLSVGGAYAPELRRAFNRCFPPVHSASDALASARALVVLADPFGATGVRFREGGTFGDLTDGCFPDTADGRYRRPFLSPSDTVLAGPDGEWRALVSVATCKRGFKSELEEYSYAFEFSPAGKLLAWTRIRRVR